MLMMRLDSCDSKFQQTIWQAVSGTHCRGAWLFWAGQGRAEQGWAEIELSAENPQLMTVYKCLDWQPGSKDINQLEWNQPCLGVG